MCKKQADTKTFQEDRLAEPDEYDLYCPQCSYNLRGLFGDPRRCPECGTKTILADLLCPQRAVAHRHARMIRVAWWCELWVFSFLVVVVISLGTWNFEPMPCGLIIGIMPWGIGVTEFKNACLSERGWMRALARFHLYTSLTLLSISALAFAVVLFGWGFNQQLDKAIIRTIVVAVVLIWPVLYCTPIKLVYRLRKTNFDRLACRAERYYQDVTSGRREE